MSSIYRCTLLAAVAALLMANVVCASPPSNDDKSQGEGLPNKVVYAPTGNAPINNWVPPPVNNWTPPRDGVLYTPFIPGPVATVTPRPVAPAPEQNQGATVTVTSTNTVIATETAQPVSGAGELTVDRRHLVGVAAIGAAYAAYGLL